MSSSSPEPGNSRRRLDGSPFVGAVIAAATGLLLSPAPASADTRYSADISVTDSASTNPYLLEASNTSAASATIAVSPKVTIREPRSETRLSATVKQQEYSRNYGSHRDYSVDAVTAERLSPKVNLNIGAGFSSAVLRSNDILGNQVGAGASIDPNLPPAVEDITLSGSQQRRNYYRGTAGLTYQPSPRDQIAIDTSASAIRYPSRSRANEYNSYGATLSYERRISGETAIGLTAGINQSNYLDAAVGDATIISPQLTARTMIDSRWSVSGGIGGSLVRISNPFKSESLTSLAGSLSICRKSLRGNFCLTGSRSAIPSALSGVRTQSSIGASYSYRLSPLADLRLTANYVRMSQPLQGTGDTVDYLHTKLDLERRLTERLSLTISGGYSNRWDAQSTRKANIEGNIGISYRFGDVE